MGPDVDLLTLRLRLRPDLILTPDRTARSCSYLIEDQLHGAFFRLGVNEYRIVSFLDGQRTIEQAWELARAAVAPAEGVSRETARALAQWLVQHELVDLPQLDPARRRNAPRGLHPLERANPFFIRIPLLDPQPLLQRLEPWLGWLFAPPALVAALLLGLLAATRLWAHWDRFTASLSGILTLDQSWSLLACWLLLKLTHEIGHGVACHRFGGSVRSAGLVLILFAPIAYMDVTSSWRFRRTADRIVTSAAGMYVELIVASCAALMWSVTSPGVWNQLCANCVVLASITTLVFNANPLMRYDGYYILTDLLGIPNLYGRAAQDLNSLVRRFFWGEPSTPPAEQRGVAAVIRGYGIASFAWRVMVITGLVVAAARLFHGAGILLSAFGVLAWVALPVLRTLRYFVWGNGRTAPRRLRFVVTSVTLATLSFVVLTRTPWPLAPTAPGFVEFCPLTIVRAATPGFVRAIHVREGQEVRTGQVLVVLENEVLQLELDKKCAEIDKLEVLCRSLQGRRSMAELELEASRLRALEEQAADLRRRIEKLTIRAPVSGTVMRRRLQSLQDTYLQEGQELLTLGDQASKEVRLSLAEDDARTLRLGQLVTCRFSHAEPLRLRLTRIAPRASTAPPHLPLCAPYGGPLPVQARSRNEGGEQRTTLQLLAPRIEAAAPMDVEQSRRLAAGQRCSALLAERPTIWEHLARQSRKYLQSKLHPQRTQRT